MADIQRSIELAAERFALEVVGILRGATLSELQALAGRAPEPGAAVAAGRGARGRGGAAAPTTAARVGRTRNVSAGRKRSPEEVARLGERVLEFLGGQREPVGVSAIAAALRVATADLGLPLSRLKDDGRVKTAGRKRSTVYRLA